jgi:hypothetical protein
VVIRGPRSWTKDDAIGTALDESPAGTTGSAGSSTTRTPRSSLECSSAAYAATRPTPGPSVRTPARRLTGPGNAGSGSPFDAGSRLADRASNFWEICAYGGRALGLGQAPSRADSSGRSPLSPGGPT